MRCQLLQISVTVRSQTHKDLCGKQRTSNHPSLGQGSVDSCRERRALLHSTPGAISWSSLGASRTTGCCENPMPEYQWALQEIAASFAVMQRNLASTSNNSLYKTANMGSQEPCCFGCIYGEGEHLQGLEESYQHLGMRKKKK